MFLTFNTESKPFPFDEWPEVDPSEGYSVRTSEDIEEAEFVEVEDVDVPSFTADEQPAADAPAADKGPAADKAPAAGKTPKANKKPAASKKPKETKNNNN